MISLTGCGSSSQSTSADTTAGSASSEATTSAESTASGNGSKTVIEYWHCNAENQGGLTVDELVKNFNENNDHIEVVAKYNPDMYKGLMRTCRLKPLPAIPRHWFRSAGLSWIIFPTTFPTPPHRRSSTSMMLLTKPS